MHRSSVAVLRMAGAVMAIGAGASVPSVGLPSPEPAPNPVAEEKKRRKKRHAMKISRESSRGSAPLRPKHGNSKADISRRERAEAKRARKLARNASLSPKHTGGTTNG